MAKMMKIIKVELKEKTKETIKKYKRHDYVRGGFRIEEVTERITTSIPHALLECGHWRRENGMGTVISKAKRLDCWECEKAERDVPTVKGE